MIKERSFSMSTVEIENYRWKCENFLKGYCPGKDCDICAKMTNRLLLKGLAKITHADEILVPSTASATPTASNSQA